MKKLVFEDTETDSPVRLYRTGKGRFTVEYGKQVTERLSYGAAAAELGQCLMHALACAGRLD